MFHVKIISVGKTKELWLQEAVGEYEKRLRPSLKFEYIWTKNDDQLRLQAAKERSLILMDPAGSLMTSEQFSQFFIRKLEDGGARLAFIIGGADGIPQDLKDKGPLLSLSPLTFTHQMARLILIEQIYRALEIDKGSDYHRA